MIGESSMVPLLHKRCNTLWPPKYQELRSREPRHRGRPAGWHHKDGSHQAIARGSQRQARRRSIGLFTRRSPSALPGTPRFGRLFQLERANAGRKTKKLAISVTATRENQFDLDSSAIIAVICREPGHQSLIDKIGASKRLFGGRTHACGGRTGAHHQIRLRRWRNGRAVFGGDANIGAPVFPRTRLRLPRSIPALRQGRHPAR